MNFPIRPEDVESFHRRARVVHSVLDALEADEAPKDWIEQLEGAEIGTLGEAWALSRYLGGKACELLRANEEIRLVPRLRDWPGSQELCGPLPELKTWHFPYAEIGDSPDRLYSDSEIVDCFEMAAKIAFVRNQPKAARACLKVVAQQPDALPLL